MKGLTTKLVLTALIALALTALFGTGTASATRLCTAKGISEVCPVGSIIKTGTALQAELPAATTAVLNMGFKKDTCKKSTLKGKTLSEGGGLGNSVSITFETATWAECTCPSTSQATPWAWAASGSGNVDGELVGQISLQVACEGQTCIYSGSAAYPLKGGTPASFSLNFELARQAGSGLLCGAMAPYTATYNITSPATLFVTKE